jgi:hypothetical protein
MADDEAAAALLDEAPVSLYIDLEEGRRANLESVARAAVAFAAAVRETAFVLDPSMSVRVELVDSTEGSVSLNALIRSLGLGDIITKKRLIALCVTSIAWFTHETGRWTFDEVLHFITGTHYSSHLSQDDKEEIAKRVAELLEHGPAQPRVEQVYHELETDDAVRGVGATDKLGEKPPAANIVPRTEFARRSGSFVGVIQTTEIVRQTRRSHERVRLIRPVLEQRGRGAWQFSGTPGRFFARIRDERFLEDVLSGRIRIAMVEGIELDVDLDTNEEKRDNVWIVISREVVHVRQVYQPLVQGSLALPSPDHPRDDGNQKPGGNERR